MLKRSQIFALLLAFAIVSIANAQLYPGVSSYPVPLVATSTAMGGGLILAGSCLTAGVSVPGATVGMGVSATPTSFPGAGLAWYGYVSSPSNVTIEICGLLNITPASTTYNIRVFQ